MFPVVDEILSVARMPTVQCDVDTRLIGICVNHRVTGMKCMFL